MKLCYSQKRTPEELEIKYGFTIENEKSWKTITQAGNQTNF